MLGNMRMLALDYLFQMLDEGDPPDDLDVWYKNLRADNPGKLFQFLVEDTETIEKIFVIKKSNRKDVAELFVRDMTPGISSYLPFVKPSGAQGAQVGPVIKRSYSKIKGGSPSRKILNTTIKHFRNLAASGKTWSSYFEEIVDVLESPMIKVLDGSILNWKDSCYESLLECVVQEIGPVKATSLIVIQDKMGNYPGQCPEYIEYLLNEKLAGDRYLTKKIEANKTSTCPLCGTKDIPLFPNALKGAGLNLSNMDREGAFPGIDLSNAWKGYALCTPCADLLYVYKNHVLKKTGSKIIRPFTARIAGESALIIPFCTMNAGVRQELLRNVGKFIKNISSDVEADEETLLDVLKDEKGIMNLTFLWADIGQNLENVTGVLTDVPPTRLRDLSLFNEESKSWKHPLFPEIPIVSGRFDLRADLSLKALYPLFHRPGGKKAQDANNSKRLFQIKRDIAAAVYHKTQIQSQRFWDEIITTARWHWLRAIKDSNTYNLLYEGIGKKGPYLTTAGWIRHITWWVYYFRNLEVLEMNDYFFEPEMESLKSYFGPESGINSPEKAYAFLLGALYGRLLEIQGGKGVNVGANALTWLKRLTLKGKDLPELYVKIRGKLLAYESEKSRKVRELINEIGIIGVKLGDPIDLNQAQTNYYLLLGQSMTRTILKKEEGGD